MAAAAIRYALFALGFAPLAYYLVSIFAAGRFFGRRKDLPACVSFLCSSGKQC